MKKIGLCLLLWALLPIAWASERVALVIGNGDYKNVSALTNPINDAKDMSKTLRGLGFEVIEATNLNRKEMGAVITEFGEKLGKNTVGLFYYAGHGLQLDGHNYLLPLDSSIHKQDEVPYESIHVDRILQKMESANNSLNIMILDACRNNPFKGRGSFRDISGGLARVNAPIGSLIIYATAPGRKAADGDGKNGLFTKYLLKNMVRPDLDVALMLRDTRNEVIQEAKRLGYEQVPWTSSSLLTSFCFVNCGTQTKAKIALKSELKSEIEQKTTLKPPTSTTVKPSNSRFTGQWVFLNNHIFVLNTEGQKRRASNYYERKKKSEVTLQLLEQGNKITGEIMWAINQCGQATIEGTIDGNRLTFITTYMGKCCNGTKIEFVGKLTSENRITGKFRPKGLPLENCQTFWSNTTGIKE